VDDPATGGSLSAGQPLHSPPVFRRRSCQQRGVADHWSDPFETLLYNRGDCDDYAILKYAALLEAGVPKDDVKIVILKNFFPNETHAAVATRVDGQ
jgi:predicted transglutaminase-like cysteine proteinase